MNIEPLLAKFQVDLALWAHVHAYERTCPIFNLTCTEGATTHAVIGMGGMDKATEVMNPPPSWIAYREIDYGVRSYSTFVAWFLLLVRKAES
jgi:acid phosphatase type 7